MISRQKGKKLDGTEKIIYNKHMIYTFKIQHAIKFSIKTHEVDQKQKRKGKDIPYITHPLTVGLILACAGAGEDVIAAGILHDTIEDSIPEKKVSKKILIEKFNERIANLVESVTEKDKELSWEERKHEALMHIKNFSHDSLLIKSADVISNGSELLEDYKKDGEETLNRFNAPKEKIIQHYLQLIRTIIEYWPSNPLKENLIYLAHKIQMIESLFFMSNYPAEKIKYGSYKEEREMNCPVCGWHGLPEINTDSHFALEALCPICEKMLLVASYPESK